MKTEKFKEIVNFIIDKIEEKGYSKTTVASIFAILLLWVLERKNKPPP